MMGGQAGGAAPVSGAMSGDGSFSCIEGVGGLFSTAGRVSVMFGMGKAGGRPEIWLDQSYNDVGIGTQSDVQARDAAEKIALPSY